MVTETALRLNPTLLRSLLEGCDVIQAVVHSDHFVMVVVCLEVWDAFFIPVPKLRTDHLDPKHAVNWHWKHQKWSAIIVVILKN